MDNNNTNTSTQNESQRDNNAPVSGNDSKPERMFTQEEVNRIVSERLAREREKNAQPAQVSEREQALIDREAAVTARENRYRCADYLRELKVNEARHGLFLDNLDTSNFDAFKKAVDAFAEPYIVTTVVTGAKVPHPPVTSSGPSVDEKIAAAFKPPKFY